MIIYCFTSIGKVRKNNEDGFLIKCIDENLVIHNTSLSLPIKKENYCNTFVVSDGMGGTEKGEVATKLLLENFRIYTFENKKELENILKITVKQLEDSNINGGCALAGIKIINNTLIIFNVGDCRVYKKHKNYSKRVSKDHSLVEELIDAGIISIEEAHSHPKNNVLTSSIMPKKDFKLYLKEENLKEDDIFLICSDGVWGELSNDELDECFENDSIEKINESIFFKLSSKEQKDNFTYILIQI